MTNRVTRRALIAAPLGVAALVPHRAGAAQAPPQPAPLTPQDVADLQRVAAYLSGIRTMTARFQQTSANGGVAAGSMWVERPGRMRFEYDSPTPILLLADRFYVYYYDKELMQTQQVGLKSTAAWFLLRDPVTFGPDVVVTRFERYVNTMRITVVERAEPDTGTLTMVLTDRPLALRQWTIVDRERKTTTVTLSNEQFGMALDPKLFQYQNPFAPRRGDQ